MKELEYTIDIEATPEKIWKTLWEKGSYEQWSSVMNDGARYEGDFSQGSIVDFYDANNNGMFNFVEENIPDRKMTLQHKGWIYNGVRDEQNWENSSETYLITENGNGAELKITVTALDEFVEFFDSNYPKVLAAVKKLAESTGAES